MGSIMGPAPKLTPKPMPKKKATGGVTSKPKPSTGSMKVFSGTGSVTKPMPELRKSGGVGGMAVKPKAAPKPASKPKPKVTPKPKPKTKPKKKKYMDATDRPGFLFGGGTI